MTATGSAARLVTLFGIALFAACEGEPGTGGDAVIDAQISVSDVRVIGTSESLAVVQDLAVLDDGSVWVINSLEPFFVGFDPAGNVIGEFGVEGGGPEEFRFPQGFVSNLIDGEAWVFDGGRHSFARVSRPEAAWEEIRIPRDVVPPGSLIGGREVIDNRVRTWRLGDEVLVASGAGTIQVGMYAFWSSVRAPDLHAVSVEGDAARTVLSLNTVLGDPATILGAPREFPPFPLWFRNLDVCGDEILVFDRLENVVRGFDSDGGATRVIDLPADELESVSERAFVRAVLGMMMAERLGEVGRQVSAEDSLRVLNEGLSLIDADRELLAAYLPRYVDLRCGGDGAFWVKPFDPDVGGLPDGHRWMRIDEAGEERLLVEGHDQIRFVAPVRDFPAAEPDPDPRGAGRITRRRLDFGRNDLHGPDAVAHLRRYGAEDLATLLRALARVRDDFDGLVGDRARRDIAFRRRTIADGW